MPIDPPTTDPTLAATYLALRGGDLHPDPTGILCLLEDFDRRLVALEKKTKLPSP